MNSFVCAAYLKKCRSGFDFWFLGEEDVYFSYKCRKICIQAIIVRMQIAKYPLWKFTLLYRKAEGGNFARNVVNLFRYSQRKLTYLVYAHSRSPEEKLDIFLLQIKVLIFSREYVNKSVGIFTNSIYMQFLVLLIID